jgi:SAM-dependent methyltransferase
MPFSLEVTIDSALAQMHTLEDALSGSNTYWSLSSYFRLALAKGSTLNPASPYSSSLLRLMLSAASPEVDAWLEAGGRWLDLGCGIGGGTLSALRAYPRATAVAVELAADLLAEAERTAVELGVRDRITFVHCDAQEYDEYPSSFDMVFWAQQFFPAPSRTGTLRAALRALKRGAILLCPSPVEAATLPGEELHTDEGRQSILERLVYRHLGMPLVGAQELHRELEGAGFTGVTLAPTPLGNLMVARRP